MEIIEVSVMPRMDAMFVEKVTAVNVRAFNVADFHQTDLFVTIGSEKEPDILIRDVSRRHVTFLCASFRMYGFNYSATHCQ